MKLKILSFLCALTTSLPCAAINVGDITSMIPSDQNMVSKEISNTTNVARFVGLKIHKLSSPLSDGVVTPMQNKAEVLATPASLVLPGDAKDVFKIIYQGPADDQERYYRLSWLDAPINDFEKQNEKKFGQATTAAQVDTILVVAPRQEKFDFQFLNGKVTNTGNSSFRVVATGVCLDPKNDVDGSGCRERYYVMPGRSIHLKYTNTTSAKTRIGIWHNDRFINVK
jgi:Mat/Ecp fimbriae periplasmic chaperone